MATAADLLYEALEPLAREDSTGDLRRYCEALTAPTLEPVYELMQDREEQSGWSWTFDPATCPEWVLPYLAQFSGVAILPGWTEEETRNAVGYPVGFKRGSPAAMIASLQRTLTGSKSVNFQERYGGNAYQLWVRSQTGETPNEAASLAALLAQKPIGIVLDYEVVDGWAWSDVVAAEATWASLDVAPGEYEDWNELVTQPVP